MRKALIALVVASGLFAVGAFAANFDVTPDDVASGAEAVGSCATDAAVSWDTSDSPSSTDSSIPTEVDYLVAAAEVTFSPTEGKSCDGAEVQLSVFLDDGTGWVDGTCGAVSGEVVTCTFEPDLQVNPIENVAILANGSSVEVVGI